MSAPAKGYVYTDSDGTVMQWDAERRCYFPKLEESFIAQYQMGYGGAAANVTASWGEFKSPEGHTYYYNSITKESSWTQPAGYQPHAAVGAAAAAGSAASASGASTAAVVDSNGASRTSGGQQLTYDQLLDQERIRKAGSQGDAGAAEDELPGPPEKKAKKDDADGFFKQDEKTNCFMYIQGLPTEDFDEKMLWEYMKKAGIVAEDDGGQPKVKLYRNADGSLKGDGRVCFLKVESVSLALTILDGGEITPGFPVSIARATFEAKAGGQRKKKGKKKKQQKETQEKKLLSWHEEKGEVSKKAAGVVVLKNAFDPKQFDEDATFLTDIQSDLRKFCTDFGEVKKVMVFDRHPDGVVSIKFTDVASAQKCMRKMNNKTFNSRTLLAEMWDGNTNYKIEETDAERDARRAKWEADLEKGDE